MNKVQSPDVMDLRMDCLNERLGGLRALTDVFGEANGEVVENAVSASNALASLDRCADVPLLRAVVKPPEDAATRAKVEELRSGLAELKARFDAGQYDDAVKVAPALVAEARVVAYQPLVAESLALLGTVSYKSDDAALAQKSLRGGISRRETSAHDEVRAEAAAISCYVVGYQLTAIRGGHQWAKTRGCGDSERWVAMTYCALAAQRLGHRVRDLRARTRTRRGRS